METAYLREYIVFSESMSFARAAKDLFVSPPTLRTHIKQLEAEVGDALLVKHGEKIEFTPVGKLFLKHAHEITKMSESALEECRAYAQNSTALLMRSYNYPPLEDLIYSVRRKFLKERPEKSVNIRFVSGIDREYDFMLEKKADISLIVSLEGSENPYQGTGIDDPAKAIPLSTLFWKNERGVLWINEGNPLFDKEKIFLSDLEGMRFILPYNEKMIAAADRMKQLFAEHGVHIQTENTPFESYEEYFFSELPNGFGLALYRDPSSHHYPPGMRIFELEDLKFTANLYLICNEENLNDCGRMFWNELREAAKQQRKEATPPRA